MKKISLLFVTLMLMFSGMSSPTNVNAAEPLKVKTTFYPVYFLAKTIAGDAADVSMLLDGGEDAHSYEMSAKDSGEVQESDLFIYQDDEMEFFVQDLLKLIDTEQTKVLESTEGIDLLAGDGHAHDHEDEEHNHGHDHEEGHDHSHEYDPHTWLDPKVYAQQAENIRDALIEADPENETIYTENATVLIDELNKLDAEYKTELKDLNNRTIVVQHAAFGYLANAYDLEQVAIAGLSTTQEPGADALAKMQDFVKENDIKVIYVDALSDNAIAQTVAQANDAELLTLSTLEVMPKDALENGEDYFSVMRTNLEQLKQNQ
ncbi:zinc ABC transporter substrate-binding protein [Aerococcaceae bacterium DSM 111020]|nr:zinc ABC transporter substrate-binding protein [Aerococcaceae bacterium DSM 111020]